MPAAPAPAVSLPDRQQVVLDVLRARDLAMVAVVDQYVAADRCDGPALDSLLAVEANLSTDTRRGLRTVATVLPHLPALRTAFDTSRVGYDVVVGCCRTARTNRLTVAHLGELDRIIAVLVDDGAGRWDADDLVQRVRDHAIGLRPNTSDDVVRETDEVRFWPGLFGDGTVVLDATPVTYKLATAVIDQVVRRHGLLDRTVLEPTTGDDVVDELAAHATNDVTMATARGTALASILTAAASGDGEAPRRPVPAMQVVVDLDTLTGDSDVPARLLGGGRLTAGAIRGMVERDGADVTAIVVDHGSGRVVGVGRRQRIAPGWLSDLVAALQPRCVVPGCRHRVCDVDHADRWSDGGATDLDNLERLCRVHHREKDEQGRWQLTPSASGAVEVTHVRSGWTATTRPMTTGPPGTPPAVAAAGRGARQPRLPLPASRPRPPRAAASEQSSHAVPF